MRLSKTFLKSSPLRFFLSYSRRKLNLELLMALLFLKFCLAIRTLYFFNKPLICPLHFAIKLYLSLFAIRLSKFVITLVTPCTNGKPNLHFSRQTLMAPYLVLNSADLIYRIGSMKSLPVISMGFTINSTS